MQGGWGSWVACAAALGATACVGMLGADERCADEPTACAESAGAHEVWVVASSRGAPIEGARVEAGDAFALTDGSGRAYLGQHPDGELWVRVTGDGFTPRELSVPLDAALTLSVELRRIDDPEPAPEPQPELDDAEIVSVELPALLTCGESATATIVVRNVGTTTWTAEGGYGLGAVDDADPLSAAGRVALLAPVPPGGALELTFPLVAPSEPGSYLSDWRMVREHVAWFGAVASSVVEVECSEPAPELPDVFDVVRAVAERYPHLLEINTYESCGELVQRVLAALDDPEWGHVGKTSGEAQHTPVGFEPRYVDGHLVTGFSHDVIYHRASNRQVDILVNASANSDPRPEIWGPASVAWGVIPPEHYRVSNPWLPEVPLE